MSLFNIFDITGSGMSAQTTRLNTIASNMANANSVASSPEEAYKSRQAVFASMLENSFDQQSAGIGVRNVGIVESQAEHTMRYAPENPLSNEQGYIFTSNVNPVEEMANMMSASRSYQSNIEVLNTSKTLLLKTLKMGQ